MSRSPDLVCVEWPGEREEDIATSKGRTPLLLLLASSLHVTQSLLVYYGSVVGSFTQTELVPPPSTTHLTPFYQCLSGQSKLSLSLQMNGDDKTYLHLWLDENGRRA